MGGRANWEELVSRLLLNNELRVCSTEESTGSAVASASVPPSFFQSDINDILAAADHVLTYPPLGPLVSRILYERAYSLSQQMDPNSRGRGVLQFKTGLKALIKMKSLKDGGHIDQQYDIELLQKFYAFYREEHKVEELIQHQSTNTRTENMRIVFATLKVIRDILKARGEGISKKFQAILESDVEKEFKPYNILPLETPGILDDKMQTFEVKAAITTLLYTRDLPRLPAAFLKPKGRELDILDLLQFCFGFQVDNVNNQREHLILLLANRQMRLGSLQDNNLLLDEEAINQVYYKFMQNYEEWCKYVMRKSVYSSSHRIKRPIKQMNLLLLALFALIWGEAANLRFLPECLCYIFHNMAEDLYEILEMEDAKRAKTWADCEHPFLEQVIVPVYKIIAEEAKNNKEGKAPHTIWRNYDDFNEYFWSSDCFQLKWPWDMNDVFFSCIKLKKKPKTYEEFEAQPQHVNRKRGGKVLFVEHRTFLHVYHSFHRLWVLLMVLLQAMTIIAFTGKSHALVKRLLSLGPTYFIMKFFQAVLDARLLYGAYSTTHKASIYRIYIQVVWFGASSSFLSFLYIKGFNSSLLLRLYILLLALYAAYNVFVSILMRIPYFYKLADQCGNGYIIRFVKWINQEQFFVGRGMYESTIDYLSYVAFWVLVLAAKFLFSYYMQIKPLVKPTQFIVKLHGIQYTWHDFFSKKNHNSLSVFWIWAPVILIYFLDIQIWYTIASAFVGGINGARSHIGEIRTLAVVHKRFQRLPKDFVSKLVPKNFHWQIGSTLSNKKNYSEKEIETIQFVPFWNEIIHSLRDEDYISNRERDLLLMPSNNERMGVIQWPLFLVANKVEISIKVAIDYVRKKDFSKKLGVTSNEQKDLWDKLGKDYMHDAIQEAYYGVSNMLKKLLQNMDIPKTWLNSFFTDVDSLVHKECLLSKFRMEVLPDILFNIRAIVEALTQDYSAERARRVGKSLQNIHEIITKQGFLEKDDFSNNTEVGEWMGSRSEDLKWPSENERSQVKRLYRLLSVESSTMDIPRNLEAQRRLTFFTNSLCMQMPDAPPVQKMLSFSVFTPYYHEDVLYSKKQLREKNEDNISTLFYLQNIYPDEWKNFLERIGSEENKVMKQLEEDKLDLMELRLWASYRGQTLARTVRGMMYYHKTIMLQSYLEKIATQDIEKNLSYESLQDYQSTRDANATAALKFIYVVSCQQYGQQKQKNDPKVADIKYLMQKNDAIRVAHIDIVETLDKNNRLHKEFYSKLVKTDSSGREQEIYSIKLPGDFKIGEGKPENQNHAIIFTRGDAIQTIDMNQDNYFEEALKMRNLLEEFDINNGIRKPSILGLREHVFTGSISSLAKFMRNQETSFVTLGQRVLANPLKARMHYGHPDVFDRVFHLTRGGISKASRVINISEDIYAGFNSTLRQGSITHHEYIQVGKGRDVGLNQIALFEAKVSSGNGEQMLSRDVYRLGNLLDFFRMMSFFYTSVGYYICTLMTVWTVYAFLYGRAYLALSGVEKDMIRQADILNNTSLQTVLNAQFLYQIGIFTAIPMIVCFILEEGLLKAIINFLTMQFELCTIFFTFSLGTRSHYFGRTILHGGAKYRATGRGFVVQRIHFTENYRLFSRSHFFKGAEIIILLIVYMAYGSSKSATSYILLMFTSWFLALSWMFAPYIFNPSGFEWNKATDDFKNWTSWLFEKGVNMKEEESWEKWWDEEQAHIRSFGSSICETILSLRFFFFQYGVVYHLGATNGSTKLTVYGISWLVLLGILLLMKVMTTSNKGTTNFQLFLRFFQGTTSLVVLTVVIVAVVKTSLTTSDVFATALALIPTCWGIICIGIAWKSMFKFLGLWKTIRALARAYDAALGTAIFAPIIILSWFPAVSTFLTRLMFNTAFSRGLEVSAILGGKEGLAESHPILMYKPYIAEKK